MYLHEIWKTYDEKEQMKDILSRMPKPRLSSSSRPSSQPTEQQLTQHQPNKTTNTNINNNNNNMINPNNISLNLK